LYIKYKDEDEYHCCKECLEEIGKLDVNGNAKLEGIEDRSMEEPSGPICGECKSKKEDGDCKLPYAKTSSLNKG